MSVYKVGVWFGMSESKAFEVLKIKESRKVGMTVFNTRVTQPSGIMDKHYLFGDLNIVHGQVQHGAQIFPYFLNVFIGVEPVNAKLDVSFVQFG